MIINDNYPQVEHLIKYLDKEDQMKTNLQVGPPQHNVSQDIVKLQEKLLILAQTIEIGGKNINKVDFAQMIDIGKTSEEFNQFYKQVEYLEKFRNQRD